MTTSPCPSCEMNTTSYTQKKLIPLYKIHLPKNLGEILNPVFESGTITEGPKAKEFQEAFQKYIDNPYTALCNSGTSAITLALKLAGVGPGTEVISSPMTCLATNEPILTLGADVKWCDVDPKTGNIDANKLEGLITSRTKAIIFVDWAGTPAELDHINYVANRNGLKTIEDAAHALGATYKYRLTGTSCDFTTFSFQAIKHLTTIDGGAVACRSKEDFDRAILLRWFGLARGHNKNPVCWEGDVIEPGYKMHMNDVNAAIGLEQLKTIDWIINQHKQNGRFYMDALRDIKGLELCEIQPYIDSAFWIFTVKLGSIEERYRVSEYLTEHGVMNSITHTRNDRYSLFKAYNTSLPGLDYFGDRMLNIPCGWWVSNDDREYIVQCLKEAVESIT